MPIDFWTSVSLDLLYARWSGHIDLRLFRETYARYITDHNYKAGRTELINLSGISGIDADFKKIWSALRLVNQATPGTKIKTRSVVIAPTDLAFGFARMYQALAETEPGIRIEVCRTEAEALDALDLPFQTVAAMFERGGFLPYAPSDA